ncbi:LEU7 protein, partial [Alcedo cyanopectus]|nr:LEU7 protein [Ceyx cyanopectus]
MDGPGALLASIRHQAGALGTLQAAVSPCSPVQPSHTQTITDSRSGPAWHSPAEEMDISESAGSREGEEEGKIPRKNPKEEEEDGELSAPSPAEPRPERLSQTQETLREKALHRKMTRLVESTSQLVQVEQTLLLPILQQHPLPLHPKDSIEFRNICSRMALQREGQHFERDLREAHQCLKTIIEKLLCSLAVFPSDSYIPARSALRRILQNLLAM